MRAVDGGLGPKAAVTVHTLSRLAGFEGMAEEERSLLMMAMEPKGRVESISVREQATQAGPGFIASGSQEASREVGVQALPCCAESACQMDLVATCDRLSGPNWPLRSAAEVQCTAELRDCGSQCEVKATSSACQAQFPARPLTGNPRAELEMDLQSGVPGWREVLQQAGFTELVRGLAGRRGVKAIVFTCSHGKLRIHQFLFGF